VDGSKLVLNQENPKVNNLLVARPELAKVLLDIDIA
jgi:hypothetical protein